MEPVSFAAAAEAVTGRLIQMPLNCPAGMFPMERPAPFVVGRVKLTVAGAVDSLAIVAMVTFTASAASARSNSVSALEVRESIHTTTDCHVMEPWLFLT